MIAYAMEKQALNEHLKKCSDNVKDVEAEKKIIARSFSLETKEKYKTSGSKAVIPVLGMLRPEKLRAWDESTSYEFIASAIALAEKDEQVKEISLIISSPGGYVSGVETGVRALRNAKKPIIAYIDDLCASAAYWLASQCAKIVVTSPVAQIGCIGVACEEYDYDPMLKNLGIEHRVYTSTDAPDKRPKTSTKEGQAKVIAGLDELHDVFISRVAQGRGVSKEFVNKNFGRGGTLLAEKAKTAGMIDEVAYIDYHVDNDLYDNEKKKEMSMTLEEFKADNPEACNTLRAEGRAEGVEAEKKRVERISAFKGINADGDTAVASALASDKSYEDALPTIQAAVLKGKTEQASGENAPAVSTETMATATADDIESAKIAGMSAEEYLKYKE